MAGPTIEPKFRRVALACDATCDIRVAVGEAAALAGRWNAELHGIFLEDENLYRLASLPFGRQMTLSSAVSETFGHAELETLSSAMSASMRRALSEAAARHGIAWSFGIIRDLPSAAALADVEADLLVVEAEPRAFAGSWHPRSSWDALQAEHARTTLIKRQKQTRPGNVVILMSETPDCEKMLASGLLMAGPEDKIAVLAAKGSDRQLAERLGASARREVRFEAAPADPVSLLAQLRALAPVLLVVDAQDAGNPVLRDLFASTRCDVLLVR
jgi:hypothetical protein